MKKFGIKYWIGFDAQILKNIISWGPEIILLQDCGVSYFHIKALKKNLPKTIFVEQNTFSKPTKWVRSLDYSFQMTYWSLWKYVRKYKKRFEKIDVLPYPIKTSSFYPATKTEIVRFKKKFNISLNNLVIGRIGQSNKGKWSDILINSFEKIIQEKNNMNFTLLLVNPPKNIVRRVRCSKAKQNIVIIKKINNDDDLRSAYSSMDIFALAAEQGESFGHVLAESMLCQIPVVALSTPWFDNSQCEVVEHMKGGLICLSPNGFKNGLIKMIEDKRLRTKLGVSARKKIMLSYDYLHVCSDLLEKISKVDENNLINIKRKIVSIYSKSFDMPNPFTLLLIRLSFGLTLTRISTGFQSIKSYMIRIILIFINKFK